MIVNLELSCGFLHSLPSLWTPSAQNDPCTCSSTPWTFQTSLLLTSPPIRAGQGHPHTTAVQTHESLAHVLIQCQLISTSSTSATPRQGSSMLPPAGLPPAPIQEMDPQHPGTGIPSVLTPAQLPIYSIQMALKPFPRNLKMQRGARKRDFKRWRNIPWPEHVQNPTD